MPRARPFFVPWSQMERKAVHTEFKVDAQKRMIEGYASTWSRDLVNDVVVPGAYTKTITGRIPKIKALRDHKSPIGRLASAQEDSTGLFVAMQVSDTDLGRETVTLVQDGVIDAMSIGYESVKADYGVHTDGLKARFLKELKLHEVSAVVFPANESALITGVKSAADLDDLLTEIKAGAYAPEIAARLLKQAADKLLTLEPAQPTDAVLVEVVPGQPEAKAAEPDPDTTLAVQSLVHEITTLARRFRAA